MSEHIAYYYFHEVNNETNYEVIYYPHYHNAINFYKNSDVQWNNTGRVIKATKENKITCLFTSNPKVSRSVNMIGSNNKIGVVFNSLGLNHFIDCDMNNISKGIITHFDYFGDSFIELAQELYSKISLLEKRDLLDTYFLDKYKSFEDQSFKDLINDIFDQKSIFFIGELSETLNIHRKTLLRKFKKHLCCTPSEFKAVVKFRKALHLYLSQHTKPKLTHIAYDSMYYDQSDFIKHCKSLVGLPPKKLFSEIKQLGENETFWTEL